MRIVKLLSGLVLVTALEALGLEHFPFFSAFDLFLVLAVTASLGSSQVGSMLSGSLTGLAADALLGGYFGLYGFANTFVAWAVNRLRQRVVIQRPLQVGVLFALAAALQQAVLAAVAFLMLPGSEPPDLGLMVARMATSGVVGAALFFFVDRFRGQVQAWRTQRRRRLRLDVD